MPRIVRLIAVFAVIVAMASVASAAPSHNSQGADTPSGQGRTCTVEEFDIWAGKVWDQSRWRRGDPPEATTEAQRQWLACAPNATARHHMQDFWREVRAAYNAARKARLLFHKRNPYYGCTSYSGCGFYALPASVVECESGGRFHSPSAPNGAYSLLDNYRQGVPTWEQWRPAWADKYAEPYEAPRKAQDIATHRLLEAHGFEPWECA